MKTTVRKLFDYKIHATDGEIGRIEDVLFDEEAWTVRYFVVDTGIWLFGRKVLIAPIAAAPPDEAERLLPVSLTKEQVKDSPDIAADPPITRAHEIAYHDYFRWPYYWGGAMSTQFEGVAPEAVEVGDTEVTPVNGDILPPDQKDVNLRSAREVIGYDTHDGSEQRVGEVEDFILDAETWALPYLVLKLEASEEKRILLPASLVRRVGPPDKIVEVSAPHSRLLEAPAFERNIGADAAYFDAISSYYGLAA